VAVKKAIRIHRFGDPEALGLDEVPVPRPRGNELLVQIHAASVNPIDNEARRGAVPAIRPEMLPITLGRNGPGTVGVIGPGMNAFRQGEPIYALLGGLDRGSYVEYVALKPSEVAPKRMHVSHVEGAAVPLAALTAWQGLFDLGKLQTGQTVPIHGGSGGVGHFAIQFAKIRGAMVLTTVSGANVDFIRELEADRAINCSESAPAKTKRP
jgi:NADPH:quinone reductase-like Zn-dependent oxidoreductase